MDIHPAATVESGAQIGDNVVIEPDAYVGPNAVIGEGCRIGHGCHIEGHTTLGENNILHPYVVLGTPPQDLKYHGEPTELVIGDDNVFREFTSINIGTTTGRGITNIGDRNFLMISSHVGHDCEIEDEVILVNGVLIGGHCKLETGSKLMGGVAVNPFVTVGRLAFVGGLSRIIHDVPPYMITEGNPAKVRRVNEVGLKRAGYNKATISELYDAYKKIYRLEKLNRMEVFEEIESKPQTGEEVLYLVEFLKRSLDGSHGRFLESLRS
ncbi:MAG: acyl-ACP--UDP-N-acetylglucosamine O-acyltransferase [Candidatus Brocadiia bacterium]